MWKGPRGKVWSVPALALLAALALEGRGTLAAKAPEEGRGTASRGEDGTRPANLAAKAPEEGRGTASRGEGGRRPARLANEGAQPTALSERSSGTGPTSPREAVPRPDSSARQGVLTKPERKGCIQDTDDPYDPAAVMPRGRYRGRCLDTHELRTLRVLTADEARRHHIVVPPGWKAIANVRHADRFWIAVVDPSAVTDVVMQIENFPAIVPAAHTELRFRFEPGRRPRLVPQRAGDPPDSVRVDDLVYSVEAAYAIGGDPYDLVKGMRDYFGLVYRVTSLDDRYQQMVVKQGHLVQQVRLRLTPSQAQATFVHALELGQRAGMGAMYHTLWRNCTTELYDVLDRSVDYGVRRRVLKNALFFLRTMPTMARDGLRVRGLLAPGAGGEWPDLTREYEATGRARPAAGPQSSCNCGGVRSSYATSPVAECRACLQTADSSAVFS